MVTSGVRAHLAFAIVAMAYLVSFPYFPRLNSPNENARIWTTRALVAHGTFAIDAVEQEWGAVSDRSTFDGHHYAAKAPGTALLGVPALFIYTKVTGLFGARAPDQQTTTWLLRVFAVILPLLLFLNVFGLAVERETGSAWARDLLTVGLGMGTLMYPNGLLFVGHATSAALVFSAYLCLRPNAAETNPTRRLVFGGILAGLAVVFEYQALLPVVVLAALAVITHRLHTRRTLAFFLGALGPALLLGAVHAALFGRPWVTPIAYVDDPIFREYHRQGFLGLGMPRLARLPQIFFGSDFGLFFYSPFLLAGLVSAVTALRRARNDAVVVLAVFGAMTLFLCGMSNWRGGWSAGGPRYIATAVPFLAWAIALAWKPLWQTRPRTTFVLAALVTVSIGLCGLAGAHFPHYPMVFENPVFQVSLRLLGQGHAPRGLGSMMGLDGASAFAPAAIVLTAAAVVALGPGRRSSSAVVGSAVLAIALFFLAALPGRRTRDRDDAAQALDLVRGAWEPARIDEAHGNP